MTKLEKEALQSCADKIKSLASLENASFDEKQKEKIQPYMLWFNCVATYIEDIIKLSDSDKGIFKKHELEQIIFYNR